MRNFILSKQIAFVPHPDLRGMWLRTHSCVVLVDCPACHSKKGIPCRNDKCGYNSDTHYKRRKAAKGKLIRMTYIEIEIKDEKVEVCEGCGNNILPETTKRPFLCKSCIELANLHWNQGD